MSTRFLYCKLHSSISSSILQEATTYILGYYSCVCIGYIYLYIHYVLHVVLSYLLHCTASYRVQISMVIMQ